MDSEGGFVTYKPTNEVWASFRYRGRIHYIESVVRVWAENRDYYEFACGNKKYVVKFVNPNEVTSTNACPKCWKHWKERNSEMACDVQ